MLQSKPARVTGLLGVALLLWPPGPAEAQEEKQPAMENLKCVADEDPIRFSCDIPNWSGGELKAYDIDVTLPNGNRFTERRHWTLRSRTDRANWELGKEARMGVKAVYGPRGDSPYSYVYSDEAVETWGHE